MNPVDASTNLRPGDHVLYFESGRRPRNALVHIVFPDHGMPFVTLLMVIPGERHGGIVERTMVPYATRRTTERGFYRLPTELWP